MSKSKFIATAAPLLLILFIDGMGLGLVFPILNDLIVDPYNGFITTALSPGYRNLLFGFVIGIFMICWFFGAPFLGDLSDQIGRKKSLMICLLGSALGYFLSGVGVNLNSFFILIFGRMIAGFTSGSQPIAQASIIDISEPQHKTRNIGIILLAISLGFVFGPLIGGVLSDQRIVPWFNFSLPFYFAAIISLLNAVLLHFYFHETFVQPEKVQLKLHRAVEIFISAFKHERVRSLSFIFLVSVFGWSSFYSFISMYLLHKFQFSALQITFFMAAMGVGFGIGNGFLAQFLADRFKLKNVVVVGNLIGAFGIFLMLLFGTPFATWLLSIPTTSILAATYSVLLTMFSNQVDEKSQGWVMGITGAIMALTFGINGLLMGFLSNYNIALPIIVAWVGIAASSIMMTFYQERGAPDHITELQV